MAITLGNGNVTYGDGTVQSTRPTLLGGSQATGYTAINVYGQQNFSASEITYGLPTTWVNPTTNLGLTPTTIVIGGFGYYRSGSFSAGTMGDSSQDFADTGTIQVRVYYRSIGSA